MKPREEKENRQGARVTWGSGAKSDITAVCRGDRRAGCQGDMGNPGACVLTLRLYIKFIASTSGTEDAGAEHHTASPPSRSQSFPVMLVTLLAKCRLCSACTDTFSFHTQPYKVNADDDPLIGQGMSGCFLPPRLASPVT